MKIRGDLQDLIPYAAGKSAPGAIKLSSNENPWGPSPKAMEAIRSHIEGIHLYPDGRAQELCSEVARREGLSADYVVAGNGSDELLVLTALAYLQPGLNAVISETTFSEYNFGVRLAGGTVKRAPLREGRFDLKALGALVDSETRIVYLCNPNNPTGTYFSGTDLQNFLDKLPPEILVVLDEAYENYSDAPDFPDSMDFLRRDPRILVTRTFSKIYGLAALRVGVALARPTVISHMLTVKQPFNLGTLALKGALAALEDREFLEKSRQNNKEQKALLYKAFEERGLKYYPSQANFICFHVNRDSQQVFQEMQSLGVSIRPLASFGWPDAIRVTVGTPQQNQTFLRVLDQALKH